MRNIAILGLSLAWVVAADNLDATFGYHMHGYGVKATAMGGISAAYAQEPRVLSSNPAGLVDLCPSLEVGIQFFVPIREYSYTLPTPDTVKSGSDLYPVPSFGLATRNCNSPLTWGIAVYGSGLGTNYPRDNPIFGTGKLGFEVEQVFCALGAALRINECHAIGVAPIVMLQRIRFYGLQNFEGFSAAPDKVTNNGYNYGSGIGIRAGWLGSFCDARLKLGVGISSKIYAQRLDKYKGLLAERGNFDSPAILHAGISYRFSCKLDLAFEYQCIFYSQIKALHNPESRILSDGLGGSRGAGLGWKDLSIFKLGAKYRWSDCLDLMAGAALGGHTYTGKDIDINILTPAVTRYHLTLGGTYRLNRCSEVNLTYVHGLNQKVTGRSILPGDLNLGDIGHKMYEHSVELGYSYYF